MSSKWYLFPFQDRTGTLLSKYMEKNKNESIKACEEALKKLGSSIKENLLLCVYMKSGGFDEYKKDIELLRKKFMQTKGLGYMVISFSNFHGRMQNFLMGWGEGG